MNVPDTSHSSLNTNCPCRKKGCPRHGDCDACRAFHTGSKYPPACERKGRLRRSKIGGV